MNKYQGALNRFKEYKNICIHSRYYEDIDTLQELINAFEYMKKYVEFAKNEMRNKSYALQELIDKQECFELYFSENHKKQFNEFFERWKKGDE